MSEIHQIFCTHCTHASSALERREGEMSHRMLGYSARAGSLEAAELRRYYRQIERYVYYYLPRDTPADAKLSFTAATAPRRLVYLPRAGGVHLIGQVCYRQYDTEGRPGSYFAHVLFADERRQAEPWSPLEVLQLWHARGWTIEDSPEIPFWLNPLGAIGELVEGRRPAIDDGVLLGFLTAADERALDDPERVIPERWRRMAPSQRVQFLVDVLQAVLDVDPAQRESLLLVVEPEIAALAFYGVFRLLPDLPWTRSFSFSTFEPNPERTLTTLTATHFSDPAGDVRAETYRGPSPVINTWSGRRSPLRRTFHFAADAVARLLSEGWPGVDRHRRDLQAAGPRNAGDLEQLSAVDRALPAILSGGAASLPADWRRNEIVRRYLRRTVAGALARLSASESLLKPLCGGPAHLLLVELAGDANDQPAARPAVDYLLRTLPADCIGDALQLPNLGPDDKAAILVRYITEHAQLPPGCNGLWEEVVTASRAPADDKQPLLAQALLILDLRALESFCQRVAPDWQAQLVLALALVCRQKRSKRNTLTEYVKALSRTSLLALLERHGAELARIYPDDEPALGQRLAELLDGLPRESGEFSRCLDALFTVRQRLADPNDVFRLEQWQACRASILRLGQLQDQRRGMFQQRPWKRIETECRALAAAASYAMPVGAGAEGMPGQGRESVLRRLGPALLGGRELLPDGVWQHEALWRKMHGQLQHGTWLPTPLAKRSTSGKRRVSPHAVTAVIAGALALAVLLIAFALSGGRDRSAADRGTDTQVAKNDRTSLEAESLKAAEAEAARQRAQREADERRAAEDQQRRQMLAEQERLRLAREREEADEKARAAWLARLKADVEPASKPAPAPAAKKVEEDDEAWRGRMRTLADKLGGLFLDRVPLVKGKASPEPLAELDPKSQRLGPGRIHAESRHYNFGGRNAASSAQHDVPALAAEFDLDSVAIALQRTAAGTVLAVSPKFQILPAEVGKDLQAKLPELNQQRIVIRDHLKLKPQTEEDNAAWNQKLREMLDVAWPRTPSRPNPDSTRFKNDKEAFKAAEAAYWQQRGVIEQQRKQIDATLRALAQERFAKLKSEIDGIERESKRLKDETRDRNNSAQAALFQRCQAVSVIVYPADKADVLAQLAAKAAPAPASNGPPPPKRPSGAASSLRVAQQPAPVSQEGYLARVQPQLTDADARPLSAQISPQEDFMVHCLVHILFDGGRVETRRSTGVERLSPVNVPLLANGVEVEFVFVRKQGFQAGPPETLARFERTPLPKLRADTEYLVTLQLTPGQLETVRAAIGKTKPRPSF